MLPKRIAERLFRPVDIAALAMFRILFGLLMAGAMVRFLAKGWVESLFLEPAFHFPWVSWIQPWPGNWMYVHVGVLAVLALMMAAGFCYRLSAALFFAGFTYLEFIDRTTYLNHYYLVTLLSGLLVFLPAHRAWSVDAWLNPRWRADTAPAWTLYVLRFQLGVVYFFAGLAKLNADWLFAAQPMRTWLMAKSDLPVIGAWLAEPWVAYAASWCGALYDLSIPFLLLCARTRPFAYAAVIAFHVLTAVLFPIGMFPWVMIVATLVFFPPDFARKCSVFSVQCSVEKGARRDSADPRPLPSPVALTLLGAYCVLQIALPARSWFYPQQGAWDGRGFNFAWRVMLVEKTGHVELYAVNPEEEGAVSLADRGCPQPQRAAGEGGMEGSPGGVCVWCRTGMTSKSVHCPGCILSAAAGDSRGPKRERIALERYITPRQRMMMAQDPHLIRLLAQHVARDRGDGWEIHAEAFATLNGRRSQRLVREDVNLAGALTEDWVVALNQDASQAPNAIPLLGGARGGFVASLAHDSRPTRQPIPPLPKERAGVRGRKR
ncbi:MAG: HTTM domain-containing protein [Verrucomicrobiota bacterium]